MRSALLPTCLLLVAAVALACPNDSDDFDGDGYDDQVDCEPENPLVNPGQEEHRDDGVDNNCDGYTDEEDTLNGPSFGDDDDSVADDDDDTGSDIDGDNDGYSPSDGDCDDTNPDVNPGVTSDPCASTTTTATAAGARTTCRPAWTSSRTARTPSRTTSACSGRAATP